MFFCVEGDERCKICKENGRDICSHHPVYDKEEIRRERVGCINAFEVDYRERHGSPNATLKDMLPTEPVDCFAGFDGEVKLWEKVSLRETIPEDETLLGHLNDYC